MFIKPWQQKLLIKYGNILALLDTTYKTIPCHYFCFVFEQTVVIFQLVNLLLSRKGLYQLRKP